MGIKVGIDGPVASGKSTVAKIVADRLGLTYIDTGAMYRAIALFAIRNNIALDDEVAISNLIDKMNIKLKGKTILVDGEDVSALIRADKVSMAASTISSLKTVREKAVSLQRELINEGNVIMDGRDIGSVVMPDAEVKIFLMASVDTRAKRRYEDNLERGIHADLENIKSEIKQRDHNDMNRAESPLVQVEDSIVLDSSSLSFDQTVEEVIKIIKEKM